MAMASEAHTCLEQFNEVSNSPISWLVETNYIQAIVVICSDWMVFGTESLGRMMFLKRAEK